MTPDIKIKELGDGLNKLEASDQIPIVHSVHLYVIVFRNKYCLKQRTDSPEMTDSVKMKSWYMRQYRYHGTKW